jgi:RNA polymerase sigma factor (sigma-70 family)
MPELLMDGLFEGVCSEDKGRRYQAISDLYALFQPILYKRLRYKFHSLPEGDLQDIVQEAFLKIYTTKSKPLSPQNLRAWIFTITTNTALDLLRQSYREQELPWPQENRDDSDDVVSVENIPTSGVGLDKDGRIISVETSLNRDIERCVADGLLRFSGSYPEREIAISLAMDGRSMQEIADLYNRTEQAMRQFVYESRKKLMPFIEHCLSEISEG